MAVARQRAVVASPMPDEAPVMTATRPAAFSMLIVGSCVAFKSSGLTIAPIGET
jgi:hypothetical protein